MDVCYYAYVSAEKMDIIIMIDWAYIDDDYVYIRTNLFETFLPDLILTIINLDLYIYLAI